MKLSKSTISYRRHLVALALVSLTNVLALPSSATDRKLSYREPVLQSQNTLSIRSLEGLQSLTFFESTGPTPIDNTFPASGPQLETRLNDLGFISRDFTGAALEFYDVFYSDANGFPNRDGAFVTIEAVWNFALPNGGGLNIAEVQLNFGPGTAPVFGNAVTSHVGLGDNFIAASVPLAADGDLQTHSTMGNTVGQSQRLRITIGFPAGGQCPYSISPAQQTFPNTGGTGTIDIFAPLGCEWIASVPSSTLPNFIELTSPVRGIGNGTVSYSVSGSSNVPRVGTIQFFRGLFGPVRQFTVTQEDARCPASAYSITPRTISDDGRGDSDYEFNVIAPSDCAWTAFTRQPWILGVEGVSGRGNATVTFTITTNSGPFRSGDIIVAGRVCTVYQRDRRCPAELVCLFFPGACIRPVNALTTPRRFRDTVLSKTSRGQRYTQLYYHFASEAVQAMLLHPSLLLRSREMMQTYMPVVEAMVKGEKPTLTKGDLEEIDSYLNDVAGTGSADLRETIKELCRDIRDPQVHAEFGLTVTEGPKRAGPEGLLSPIKKSGMMIAPLGLILFGFYAKKRRRRNTLNALNRLLSVALVLTLAAIQWHEAGSQPPLVDRQSDANVKSAGEEAVTSQVRPPITFEANLGQTDPQVKFISRANDSRMFLTATEAVIELRNQKSRSRSQAQTQLIAARRPPTSEPTAEHQPPAPDVLRMKLVGANVAPNITGVDQFPVNANYFIGSDPAKWRESVPAFSKVKYQDVYRGVDLVYYGSDGELEYDFIAAPGVDPAAIGLSFGGADQIYIDPLGDLVLRMSGEEVRQRQPVAYQDVDGERIEVPCRYIIRNPLPQIRDQVVGFDVGSYDTTRPLIIDPVFVYSTYLGGSGADEGNSIAVDTAGNVYVVGFTDSLNFPSPNNSQSHFGGGQQDAFVAKLDPSGTRVVYSAYVGGDGQDNGTGIAVDSAGNAYVTGYTGSTNFPVQDALQTTKAGEFNSFMFKLGPTGSILQSTLLGGSFSDHGSSIAVDAAGNIYVAGIATSTDFPMANAIQSTFGGSADVFVAKLHRTGTRIVYSTYLGGAGVDGASSIVVDSESNLYLTGLTSSPNFPTAHPVQGSHSGGIFDAFVTKLDPSGSLVYSTYLGGSGVDRGLRISVDRGGGAAVVGDTDSLNFPVFAAVQPTIGGGSDAFVAGLSSSGMLEYSTYLGGSGNDGGTGVAVHVAGTYVTGFTNSSNFPVVAATQSSIGGAYDGFVARFVGVDVDLDYSTFLGGSGIDSAFGIVVDAGGNAYLMGLTDSSDFPIINAFQTSYGGGTADLFVAKVKAGPTVSRAEIQGKNLLVFGNGFDAGARILLEGEPQKTRNDDVTPAGILFGKKVGKKIAQGTTVTLQVRNSDGTLSNQLSFTRP